MKVWAGQKEFDLKLYDFVILALILILKCTKSCFFRLTGCPAVLTGCSVNQFGNPSDQSRRVLWNPVAPALRGPLGGQDTDPHTIPFIAMLPPVCEHNLPHMLRVDGTLGST
jgi:hypothetical protein